MQTPFVGRAAQAEMHFHEPAWGRREPRWLGARLMPSVPTEAVGNLFQKGGQDFDVTGKPPGEKEGEGGSWVENCFGEESQEKMPH